MARQRNQSTIVVGGRRRKTQWYGFGDETGAAAEPNLVGIAAGVTAIVSTSIVVAGGIGALDEEITFVRMIGALYVETNGSAGTVGQYHVGALVQRTEAIIAGVAAMPNPMLDPDAEWLYWASGIVKSVVLDANEENLAIDKIRFDVKGMRKLERGENIVWLARAGDNAIRLGVTGRYLAKLP